MNSFLLLIAIQLSLHFSAPTALPEAREGVTQTSHSPISSGDECVNNSLDNGCRRPFDRQEAYTHSTIIQNHLDVVAPDNQAQLSKRCEEIDRLDGSPLLSRSPGTAPSATQHDEALDQPSLRQVILIHRHGDRTPTNFEPKDPLKDEPFWKFHGLGQLTNRGKARVFWLGKIVRDRYNQFLLKSVNKNQRISRSSGSLRCIESAQGFLSGFIELNLPGSMDASKLIWDQTTNPLAWLWQPASIQSVPARFDGMLAESAQCEKLMTEYTKVINSSSEVRTIFAKFQREGQVLADTLGFEMDYFWKWFWASSQVAVERSYFPDKMRSEILAVYDRIIEAGALTMGAYQSTLASKRLRSGLLINDMVRHMNNFSDLYHKLDGDSPALKKFVHYSAHDLTLVVLLGMFDSWDKFNAAPDFASNIVIELHQDKSEWFVRIFYMPHVPADYVELHLDRCESGHPTKRCTLDKFTQLMKPYMIDSWQAWMKECGNDIGKIDPYADGA